jgi:EAL domain-containing protein (putative c-di-GMP-specific phosphodiesterase class I)/CheY-like chemotaxis protein
MTIRPTILIADDDPEVAKLLGYFLRPLDCEILVAYDGEQALAIAQARIPDLVLLDVVMPKRSGWEVCQALKAVHRTAGISVVLVTGRGEVKDRLTGLQVGADDYLVKPFVREEVVKRIEALLERRRVQQADQKPEGSALEGLLTDRATGLPTIPMVMERLRELLIEQGELGIVFVDIEQYESIEADYGWAYFDEFLRQVAAALSTEATARFRNAIITANLVAGSSFCIFFETRHHDAESEAAFDTITTDLRERLIEALRQRFPKMQTELIGFFVGAARIEYRPQIRLERQIYHGMRVASDAVRDAEQARKRQLTRELRDIIRRKRITTMFQPIVWAADGSVFGYEILTRGSAHSSFRNSDMLFAFAREAKLAWALEAIALETVLRKLEKMDLKNYKFLLNLEAEMFEQSEFRIHEVSAYFAKHRGNFVFELTERAAIEDYAVFRRLIDEFREKGIEVAIDDAGSGYASLEAIAALAPDFLKITKGLVSTLPTEPIKQDLVKMLVELSGKIGAKTIAEGIETAEEYECCRELGIDLIQGYYIAHPQETIETALQEVAQNVLAMRAAGR